jgi:hypothetical protein
LVKKASVKTDRDDFDAKINMALNVGKSKYRVNNVMVRTRKGNNVILPVNEFQGLGNQWDNIKKAFGIYGLEVDEKTGETIEESKKILEILTPRDCYNILRNVSDTDCMLLGFNPKVARPEDLVIHIFPVPPVSLDGTGAGGLRGDVASGLSCVGEKMGVALLGLGGLTDTVFCAAYRGKN